MSLLSQFISSGGSGFLEQRVITKTGSFTAPVNGKYLITAIGSGAGGTNSGRGGGAGGFAQKLISLTAGTTITCVVGSAGAANGGSGALS